ncbi:MAG TPA: TlpA disulfide reductase family protein [Polyangia bacterium]|nr:TlpA disulfide reductase family protein [Polyangia bacterium]
MNALLLLALLARHGELLSEGTPAPRIEAYGHDGRAFGADFAGRITIVDFFATWCPHCRESLSGHDRLMRAFGDRVRLLVIDVDEEPAFVRAFFARRALPPGAELLFDRASFTSRAWRVTGFPTLYVVDRGGFVRWATSGYDDSDITHLSRLIPKLENERPRARTARGGGRGGTAADTAADDARARAMGVQVLR